MAILGEIKLEEFLSRTDGRVLGKLITDGKIRSYAAEYKWQKREGFLFISRKNDSGSEVKLEPTIPLDESLISFFGLYSGDGAKGSESEAAPGIIKPVISLSQREPNLVRFAVEQFRRVFGKQINFVFSLGEDSAFFMEGEGKQELRRFYGGKLPSTPELPKVQPYLSEADKRYLSEKRPVSGVNEEHLAFYYFHKRAMEEILTKVKRNDLLRSGVKLGPEDRATASLRRPFKKGARVPGGSSRSDEIHVGGLTGIGELFLKILHEIESSIFDDTAISPQGLIKWLAKPSSIGKVVDVKDFFKENEFGKIAGERPLFHNDNEFLEGQWPRSKTVRIKPTIQIDPLWCYVSGLYLAEGSTPKSSLFAMYKTKPKALSIGFTSSENISIELMLRALQRLFPQEACLDAWKIKVGSQYFPELVVIGIKSGVPMLRGGESGDGKIRTMEISLSLKDWALEVVPSIKQYADKYSHVEPTGAGLARIDFWASSSLGKWFFPLIMFSTFGNLIKRPEEGFIND